MPDCSVYVPHGNIGSYCRKQPVRLINGKYYCKLHEPDRVRMRFNKRIGRDNKAHAEWQIRHDRDMLILGLFYGISAETIEQHKDDIKAYLNSLTKGKDLLGE